MNKIHVPFKFVKKNSFPYIPQHLAAEVNDFFSKYLNPYLNFHRPCLFPEEMIDAKGKVRKRYPQNMVMTPLEKLLSLKDCERYLKKGVTQKSPQEKANGGSDNRVG